MPFEDKHGYGIKEGQGVMGALESWDSMHRRGGSISAPEIHPTAQSKALVDRSSAYLRFAMRRILYEK